MYARRLYASLARGSASFCRTLEALLAPRRFVGPVTAIALTASAVAPAPVQAEDAAAQAKYEDFSHEPLLPVRLDGHMALTWDAYFGLGARVDIPVMKSLTYSTRDELSISLGVDMSFVSFSKDDQPLQTWPTATIQWSLGIAERFTFYPELGLVAKIDRQNWDGIFPNVGFGGRYALYRSASLLGRVGWPMALSLGATF